MSNFILNHVMIGGKPMAKYIMKQAGGNVRAETTLEKARWMLENDKEKPVRMSDEIAGYPLTADGIYFFDGALVDVSRETNEAVGDTSSDGASAATFPSKGKAFGEAADVEIGADGLPIPATAEKPKAKKRAKDVVCE